MAEEHYTITGILIPPPPRRPPPRVCSVQNPEIPRTRYDVIRQQVIETDPEICEKYVKPLCRENSKAPPLSPVDSKSCRTSIKIDGLSQGSLSTSTENTPRLHYYENTVATPSIRSESQHHNLTDSYRGDIPTLTYVHTPSAPIKTEIAPVKKEEGVVAKERRHIEEEEWRKSRSCSKDQGKSRHETPIRSQFCPEQGPGGGRGNEWQRPNTPFLATPVLNNGFRTPLDYSNKSYHNTWSRSPTKYGGTESCLMGCSPSPAPPFPKKRSMVGKEMIDSRWSPGLDPGGRRENVLFPSRLSMTSSPPKNLSSIYTSPKIHHGRKSTMLPAQSSRKEEVIGQELSWKKRTSSGQRSLLEEEWCTRLRTLLTRSEMNDQRLWNTDTSELALHQIQSQVRLEGMEILSPKPKLQSTQNSSTRRYFRTLQDFRNSQPVQLQEELDKVFQQYAGKEDILCSLLSLFFAEEFREFSFTTPSKSRHSTPNKSSPEKLTSPVAHHQQRAPHPSMSR